MYGGVDIQIYGFLTLALDSGEEPALSPGCFIQQQEAPNMDAVGREKSLLPPGTDSG